MYSMLTVAVKFYSNIFTQIYLAYWCYPWLWLNIVSKALFKVIPITLQSSKVTIYSLPFQNQTLKSVTYALGKTVRASLFPVEPFTV